MTVVEIAPEVDRAALLAGAQFVDAYSITVDSGTLDARHAAERMITRQPRWAEALLTLRNILVKPFGLKTSGAGTTTPRQMIGIFPIVSETPDRLVAGFQRQPSGLSLRGRYCDLRRSPEGDRDHAGADA